MSEEKKTLKQNVDEILDGWLTVPNVISFVRIALIPVFAVLYYKGYIWWSLLVLFLSGLSDAVDGKIARRFNQVSNLGKLLDPMADKLTVFAIAIVFFLQFRQAESESMQAFSWVFLLFIAKDIIMILGSIVIISLGARPSAAEIWGKLATFAFYVIMVIIIGFGAEVGAITKIHGFEQYVLPESVMFVLVVIAVVLTFVAFFSYLPSAIKQILENMKAKKQGK